MNTLNWKRVRECLSRSLEHEFSDRFKKEKKSTIPGAETFVSSESLPTFFLVYYRSSNFNAFFSELAWSRERRWPPYPSLASEIESFELMHEARFRIEQFWLVPPYTMQAWCLTSPLGLRQLDPVKDRRMEVSAPDVDIEIVARQYCDKVRDFILPTIDKIKEALR